MNKQFSYKTLSLLLIFSLVLVGVSISLPNNIEAKGPKTNSKILICHRTGSATNPWNVINVSINAKDAHFAHGDYLYEGGEDLSKKEADDWCSDHTPTTTTTTTPTTTTTTVPPICGNDLKEGNEQCDGVDGIIEGENFCSTSCHLVPIYSGNLSCPQGTIPELINTYTIDSSSSTGTAVAVEADKSYLFGVSGTFSPTSASGYLSDAGHTLINSILSTQYGIYGTPPDLGAHALLGNLGLGVGIIDWGAYDFSHEYNFSYTIPSSFTSAQFVIGDRYGDWFDTPWQNQAGVGDNSGNLTLEVYECKPNSTVTICKYDEEQNPLEGWKLLLKGDLVQNLIIYPRNTAGTSNEVTISDVLPLDDYILIANGQYVYRPGTLGAEYSDAGYTKRKCPGDAIYLCSGPYAPWFNVYDINSPYQGYLGIMVNDAATNWGSYFNSGHTYALGYPNHSGSLSFTIKDDQYSDNSGQLNIDIYEGYAGETGEDGCITFTDVQLGTYSLEEILKDGWQNVSGLGQVIVDESQETFTVINSGKEQACINSGGTIGTSLCCTSVGDFPNTCQTGACGCAPKYSHEVQVCNCPEGKCFNGNTCVTECIEGLNLLKNGSFEFPEVTNSSKWQLFPSGTALLEWIVGWVSTTPSDPPKIEIHEGVLVAASDGDQSVELDSEAPTYIYQDVSTEAGYEYQLTFDFAGRPNTPIEDNKLEIWADGILKDTISSNTSWAPKTYNFVATTNLTEIKFVDAGIDNSLGTFLDNVRLECVAPEL